MLFGEKTFLKSNKGILVSQEVWPFHQTKYSFSNGIQRCEPNYHNVFLLAEDLSLKFQKKIFGKIVNYFEHKDESFILVYDKCTGLNKFISLDNELTIEFPNKNVELSSAKFEIVNGKPLVIGWGIFKNSYLDRVLKLSDKNRRALDFLTKKDFIISQDSGFFLFSSAINKNMEIKNIKYFPSKMTSYISSTFQKDNGLYIAGNVDRDRAYIWKLLID